MEGEIFLESYSGESVDELIKLQKTHWIDSLVLAFESALSTGKYSGRKLSDTEIIILAVEALEREVNNGGYSQFFYNASVEYVNDIVSSLHAIGCHKTAGLTQKAIDCLGLENVNPETIEEKMFDQDEAIESSLEELDNLFYQSDEGIAYKLFEYISKNRENIKLA